MGMKSTGLSIDRNAIWSGLAHLDTIRGSTTWGANWVFNSGGVQNDIRLIADELKNLSTSGSFATDVEVSALSGYIGSGMSTLALDSEISILSGYIGSGMSTLALDTEISILSGYIGSGMSTLALDSEIDILSGYIGSGMSTLALNSEISILSGFIGSGMDTLALDTELDSLSGYITSGPFASGMFTVASIGKLNGVTSGDATFGNVTAANILAYTAVHSQGSGTAALGLESRPWSDLIMISEDTGVPMSLRILSDGTVSGYVL